MYSPMDAPEYRRLANQYAVVSGSLVYDVSQPNLHQQAA